MLSKCNFADVFIFTVLLHNANPKIVFPHIYFCCFGKRSQRNWRRRQWNPPKKVAWFLVPMYNAHHWISVSFRAKFCALYLGAYYNREITVCFLSYLYIVLWKVFPCFQQCPSAQSTRCRRSKGKLAHFSYMRKVRSEYTGITLPNCCLSLAIATSAIPKLWRRFPRCLVIIIVISDKEVMFSVAFVCWSVFLPVCLSVTKASQRVMNGLQWIYLMEGSEVIKGTSN